MNEIISPSFVCFQIPESTYLDWLQKPERNGSAKRFSFCLDRSDKKCMAHYETENLCVKSLALVLGWLNNGIEGKLKHHNFCLDIL